MAEFLSSGVHDIILYQSQSTTIFLRHGSGGSYSEIECFPRRGVSTPPLPLTRFSLAQSIVSKLTADVFCTSLWRPPVRTYQVHATHGADVICYRDLYISMD
jgi:hypothetical protein